MLWLCPTSSQARATGQAWPHQGPANWPGRRGIGDRRRRAGPRNTRSPGCHARLSPADQAARSGTVLLDARHPDAIGDLATASRRATTRRLLEMSRDSSVPPSGRRRRPSLPGRAIPGTPFQYAQYIRNNGPWTRASLRTGKTCPPGGAFLDVQPPRHTEPAASVTGNGGRHQAPEAPSAHSATSGATGGWSASASVEHGVAWVNLLTRVFCRHA